MESWAVTSVEKTKKKEMSCNPGKADYNFFSYFPTRVLFSVEGEPGPIRVLEEEKAAPELSWGVLHPAIGSTNLGFEV